MRVIFGLLFLSHGLSKLAGIPVPPPPGMPPPLLYATGFIELICGALVAVGLFTRWAAFIASGEMAVAYFMVHFPRGPYPIANQGELAVLYCFGFLLIATHGPGMGSVDRQLRRD
jgi:putative oxidoreductase